MYKRYKFIGNRGVGSLEDITLGWKRKSKFTVQSNGKCYGHDQIISRVENLP